MENKTNARTGENGAGANAKTDGEMMHKDTDFQIPNVSTGLNDVLADSKSNAESIGGSFPAEVFDNLPPLLAAACNKLADHSEREVFLVGGLGVLSGILPNVHGFYDHQFYTAHLYVFILAPYGSGKGSLSLARKLGQAIDRHKRELSTQAIAAWKAQCIEAKEDKEPEPDHPGNKRLFLPADNSKSGFLQLLHENERGIMYESEGDTLADAFKTDHGGYSDILRKAFHHEPISFFRRTERENRDIEAPELAVVMSATFDQYTKLVPTPANGLFSRFLHFNLKSNPEFRDVFSDQRRDYPEYFDELGEKFKGIFLQLEALEESKIEFNLRQNQRAQFLKLFAQWKAEFKEFVSADMEGTANRLGLICFRISMVLSCVRSLGEGDFTQSILCTDQDFENALRIIEVFKCHALEVFHRLPRPTELKAYTDLKDELQDNAAKVRQCQRLYSEGKGPTEIAIEVYGDSKQKSKVFYWAKHENNPFKKLNV